MSDVLDDVKVGDRLVFRHPRYNHLAEQRASEVVVEKVARKWITIVEAGNPRHPSTWQVGFDGRERPERGFSNYLGTAMSAEQWAIHDAAQAAKTEFDKTLQWRNYSGPRDLSPTEEKALYDDLLAVLAKHGVGAKPAEASP